MYSDKTNLLYLRVSVMLLLIMMIMLAPHNTRAQEDHPHEPPRPQPIPPTPIPDRSKASGPEQGAWIELHGNWVDPRLWTTVQWQDGTGNWHEVTNWQGTFNEAGVVTWFVEQKDFNKGPFRWVVYQGQGGAVLTISPSFYLPTSIGQVVRTDAMLPTSVPSYQPGSPSYQPNPPMIVIPAQLYVQVIDPWSSNNQYNPPAWYSNDPWSSQCSRCHRQ